MKEACIYKRPEFSLSRWSAYRDGADLRVMGFWREQQLKSADLRFIDTEQQVAIDADGAIWHLPPGEGVEELGLTEEILALYLQPRFMRKPAVLVMADDCPELRRLLSKK